MRIAFIFLLWLLLGVFFFKVKDTCCSHKTHATTVVPAVEDDTSTVSDTLTTDVSGTDSTQLDQGSDSTSADETSAQDASTEVQAETRATPQAEETTSESNDRYTYDDATYNTITQDGNASIIPFSDTEEIGDEIMALLEKTCSRLSDNMSKVRITAYGSGQGKVLSRMENFLIRCGVSPGRVSVMTSSSDNSKYSDNIVLDITN